MFTTTVGKQVQNSLRLGGGKRGTGNRERGTGNGERRNRERGNGERGNGGWSGVEVVWELGGVLLPETRLHFQGFPMETEIKVKE